MGFAAKLFLPLIAVLAAIGTWLAIEHDRGTVFAIGPAEEEKAALAPAAGAPAAEPAADSPARERFARSFDRKDSRPRIAVIVTGLGLAREPTLRAIEETPGEVTLAFSPYADEAGPLVARARERGHEILIAVPMEAADAKRRDAGPAALAASLNETAARNRLAWMMTRISDHVGVIGDLGDGVARDPAAMRPVLDLLASKGLLYIDNRLETGPPAGGGATPANAVPTAAVTIWLDRDLSGEAIDREIAEAEAYARRERSVVVVARPYPLTLARISAWMKGLDRKGLAAAPVSAVTRGGS